PRHVHPRYPCGLHGSVRAHRGARGAARGRRAAHGRLRVPVTGRLAHVARAEALLAGLSPRDREGRLLDARHAAAQLPQAPPALRNHMYDHDNELVEREMAWGAGLAAGKAEGVHEGEAAVDPEALATAKEGAKSPPKYKPIDLSPEVLHPDVLWACTTCRACE